jgi:3-deoxy-D-manno-octulosonate 8-phosphate phosphatase (KDO 8-P phosphatase)
MKEMTVTTQADVIEKAKKVKFVILDIHGVLTDLTLYYTDDGKKSEMYSLHDRFGCAALKEAGIEAAFLTSKITRVDQYIGSIYKIDRLYGTSAKISQLDEIEKELGLTDEEFCYVGDEIIDIGIMKRVGFAVAPANAAAEVKAVADYITKTPGGRGVVRELAKFILQAQGKWDTVVEKLSKT